MFLYSSVTTRQVNLCMKIEDYVPPKHTKTYYISPSNSLCFMNGGFDLLLSTIIFPNIHIAIKKIMKELNIKSILLLMLILMIMVTTNQLCLLQQCYYHKMYRKQKMHTLHIRCFFV